MSGDVLFERVSCDVVMCDFIDDLLGELLWLEKFLLHILLLLLFFIGINICSKVSIVLHIKYWERV